MPNLTELIRPERLPRLLPEGVRGSASRWQAAAALTGFVLGGGQVYGGAAPFGLALVLGCPRSYLLPAAAGAIVGGLLRLPTELALKLALALAAATAGRLSGHGRYPFGAALGCGSLLLLELLNLLIRAGTLSGVLTPVDPAEVAALSATALLGAGFGMGLHLWPVQKPAGACLWLAILTACLQRFSVGVFAPGLLLTVFVGLCTAYAGTLEQSTVLSIALGAALAAASPALCSAALAVALGTLAGGGLFPGERGHCALLYIAGCTLGLLAAPDRFTTLAMAIALPVSVAVYFALPTEFLRRFFPQPAPPAAAQGLSSAARRLAKVADTLSDVAETVNAVCERQTPPKGETFDYVVEYTARQVCQTCSRRSQCWIKGYATAMDGLYKLKQPLETNGQIEVENLPPQLTVCVHPGALCGAVNHGYRLWRSRRQTRARATLLRTAITEQYSAMAAALAQLSARLGQAGLPDPRREAKVVQLFADIGLEALECTVSSDLAGRVTANVTVSRSSFTPEELSALTTELSRICRRDFGAPEVIHCRTVTMLSFGEKPLYRAVFGSACRCAPGQEVSGDALEQFCDPSGRAQVLLCDGMGTGRAAAVDGQMAAKLTGQLLRAGFAAESAARLVNVALGLKSADSETGATLDLLTIDLFTGRAGLFKAGAAPSFVVRGDLPHAIEGSSLPMGVTDSLVGRSNTLTLDVGDWVVLLSDGALCDGTGWLLEQLQLCARLHHTPGQAAATIADAAVRRSGSHQDDITVAVVQLERA